MTNHLEKRSWQNQNGVLSSSPQLVQLGELIPAIRWENTANWELVGTEECEVVSCMRPKPLRD